MALSIDDTAAVERHSFLDHLLNISPLAILYYDYVLTFSREVEYFWPKSYRTSWISLLFFLNRYLAIFGNIPIALGLLPDLECQDSQYNWKARRYKGYFGMTSQLLVAVLCSMRVCALYNKNYYILFALTVLVVASIVSGCIVITTETREVSVMILNCNTSLGLSHEGGRLLSIPWGGLLVFDIAVFILTVYKASKVGYKIPLIRVLLRDGSLYFVVLFFVNLANILTLQFAPTSLKNSATPLTNVLSTTLISRLMLRLRSDRFQLAHRSYGTAGILDTHCSPSPSQHRNSGLPTTCGVPDIFETEYPLGQAREPRTASDDRRSGITRLLKLVKGT